MYQDRYKNLTTPDFENLVASNKRIRESVKHNKSTTVVVTNTTSGNLSTEDLLKEEVKLSEQEGNENVSLGIYKQGKLITDVKKSKTINDNIDKGVIQNLISKEKRVNGQLFAIYRNENGFVAQSVSPNIDLNDSEYKDQIIETIYQTLLILGKGQPVIINSLNIGDFNSAQKFLADFVNLKVENRIQLGNNEILIKDENNNIIFKLHKGSFKTKMNPYTLQKIREAIESSNLRLNWSYNGLEKNYTVKFINKRGEIEDTGLTYEDYLKTSSSTRIPLYNVGTTENPLYTPYIKRTIGIELYSEVNNNKTEEEIINKQLEEKRKTDQEKLMKKN
jgi:hypothetical protein